MKNIVIALAVVLLGAVTAQAEFFTAYNDCRPSGSIPNTTLWGPGQTGLLKDFDTGIDTGVSVQVDNHDTNNAGTGGPVPVAGDAHAIFDGKLHMDQLIYYGGDGWYVNLNFTGLDPAKRYNIASVHNRNPGDGKYEDRWSVISIQDADSSTYAASAGAYKVDDNTVSIVANNLDRGYVAGWNNISPGSDGDFTIHYTHATDPSHYPAGESQDGRKAYGPAGFMLQEIPEPSTLVLAVFGLLGLFAYALRKRR